jgi:hypothetical protein
MSLYDDFPIDYPRYDNKVRVYGGERSSSRRRCEKTLRHFGSARGTCTKSYRRQAQTPDEEIGVYFVFWGRALTFGWWRTLALFLVII